MSEVSLFIIEKVHDYKMILGNSRKYNKILVPPAVTAQRNGCQAYYLNRGSNATESCKLGFLTKFNISGDCRNQFTQF